MRLEDPSGAGPTFLMAWGEIQKSLGRLESAVEAGRQAIIDQGRAMLQRQDDMRRETLTHHVRLERRVEKLEARKSFAAGLLRWIPWREVITGLVTLLGALNWIKPEWMPWFKLFSSG